jgi:hypothetical protein
MAKMIFIITKAFHFKGFSHKLFVRMSLHKLPQSPCPSWCDSTTGEDAPWPIGTADSYCAHVYEYILCYKISMHPTHIDLTPSPDGQE